MNDLELVQTKTGELSFFDSAEMSKTALVLQENLSFERWQSIGEHLKTIEGAVMWWIGDWLNYGESKYGEMYSQALEITDYDQGTLQNAKWVASKYESSYRYEDLSHTHHMAALSSGDPIAALAWAEENNASVKALRHHIRDEKRGIERFVEPPSGEYSVIYADPPWRYEYSQSESREIENQYPTMDLDSICNLAVPAADDCVLFLWATSPKLEDAMRVIDSWGFTYRTCAIWDKQKIGMGYYFRQQHELLLVATKGSPPVSDPSDRVSSVISAPRGEHSRKPEIIYEVIESMYHGRPMVELFCREPREGWAVWGNEVAA